ncbi:adenylate/guanylate cyclase domain-containing protein (plasmid) [Tistrella mobilis]|uniref:Adenylate/guanylate cyclase domain-containing protein n=1 Tax=Tistrella mobilis TaxID=171437 RepID=A0A162JVM2_9PROT|nr:adenylate/guanylate cyclase domain-containing protein [Tistrella mobilis]KYO49961.1 hypothetical protein AUP44_01555 [Tistrella mobilis]
MRPPAPVLARLRIISGIILFLYASCHFLTHASGILTAPAMEATSRVLLVPWKGWIGHTALYGAFTVHAALGLHALWRRRHLRMSAVEAWQLGLGLLIPLIVIRHAVSVRLGEMLYGLDDSYWRLLAGYWLPEAGINLFLQLLLLVVVWVHGCIGLYRWLRFKTWFMARSHLLLVAACLVPVLAVIGIAIAGADIQARAAAGDLELARMTAVAPEVAAAARAGLGPWVECLTGAWVLLVGGVLAGRLLRDGHARHFRAVRIRYAGPTAADGGETVVTVPRGWSVLEASLSARIPHASICGGQGRCSTCRVRVLDGRDQLPPPRAVEAEMLRRIRAPGDVRLACQLRPPSDLTVQPLIPPGARFTGALVEDRTGTAGLVGHAREAMVVALFTDLRASTRLAAERTAYDALYLIERYVDVVTEAVTAAGGRVTGIAGDGVMSVFGGTGPVDDVPATCRAALAAAAAIWDGVEALSAELRHELDAPLRIGIGVHLGPSVVGTTGVTAPRPIQFLGDTGNVAARLEEATKAERCTLILSEATVAGVVAGGRGPGPAELGRISHRVLDIRGRGGAIAVRIVATRAELDVIRGHRPG